jgi:UDP-glucose 4-epimerase
MKVLITGSTGFVGKNLCEFLKKEGVEIITYERYDPGYWIVSKGPFDCVFHCAAELDNEALMVDSNIGLTKRVLDWSIQADFKTFIYLGSSSEYAPWTEEMSEKNPTFPESIYAATKTAAADFCMFYAMKHHKRVVTVRPFSLYGPHDKARKFFPTIYESITNNERSKIFKGVHDWVYIDDFINSLWAIANFESAPCYDIVNIGTGKEIQNIFAFQEMRKAVKNLIAPYEYTPTWMSEHDRRSWRCDPEYAREKYGIVCKTTLEEGLRKYVDFRRQNPA